jgi:CheY-like chemotaxis protein
LPRGQAGETILVVEDDIDVRRYTTGTLREFGYTVFEACGSRDALAVLETEPSVHLLLTDLGLPEGMDGRTLGEEARRRRPSLKVLITTAYAAASLVHNDRLDAGVDLLTKPFTRAALATRVRQLLDTRLATATAPRVLLVEDEVLVRLYARQMLTDLGCEVWEAGSSAEAQAKLHEARDGISAAIIDLGLPDRPGRELVAEIRAARPRLPIVLTTGYVDETVRRQVADDRMTIIVDKPYQPHDLGAALERLGISAKRA